MMIKDNKPIYEQQQQQTQDDSTRVSMEPLYEKLLKKPFPTSALAIEYCRSVCADFGFTVKQEASANRNIYVYCSREGLPDSVRNPKPSPQRKRPSKRCDCRWRVVLSENEHKQWEFRKSMNPNASEHNHAMLSPDEMVKAWPSEVTELIVELARQKLQTHEIRETVRQRYPSITWNERRFYNRLTEERKRIRQRSIVERAQRLLLLSGKLCSVAASNDEWTLTVEDNLQHIFVNLCEKARLSPDTLLTDLQPNMIQLESDRWLRECTKAPSSEDQASPPTKKRKTSANQSIPDLPSSPEPTKGVQLVHVPSYNLQVQLTRPFTDKRLPTKPQSNCIVLENQTPSQAFSSSSAFYPLASPTSTSSTATSSSMPFPKQARTVMTSPQQSVAHNEYAMSYPPHTYSGLQSSFPYNSFTATSPPELPFFESGIMHVQRERERHAVNFYPAIEKEQQQQQSYDQRMQHSYPQPVTNFSLPMIRPNEEPVIPETASQWN
ncbi:hypothetical protein RMCBS344292_00021 [Rhizopus microsporus]|nr:hypothetical protein RMCBS344292_00021 [Rhizopus microsporus]